MPNAENSALLSSIDKRLENLEKDSKKNTVDIALIKNELGMNGEPNQKHKLEKWWQQDYSKWLISAALLIFVIDMFYPTIKNVLVITGNFIRSI